MSDSLEGGSKKNVGRNLPSWMSAAENENESKGKKPVSGGDEESNAHKTTKQSQGRDQQRIDNNRKSLPPSSGASKFSKLLEGVVFVLSGFVNPERSILRSQALEMGAKYVADWDSDCTLLICAFPNTPKFRQVEADCGTVVSKEWISECYSQKKLVDIDGYLMHVGKPWRKQKDSMKASQELQSPVPRGSYVKSTTKSGVIKSARFSPSEVKMWVFDDFNKAISSLESKKEKPEASEIKSIAAGGILAFLEDIIDAFQKKQDIHQIIEQWNFVPRAIEELKKLDSTGISKEELCKEATTWKQIYEAELSTLNKDLVDNKRPRTDPSKKGNDDYDSDETIEMTEDEIDLAFGNVASKLGKQ